MTTRDHLLRLARRWATTRETVIGMEVRGHAGAASTISTMDEASLNVCSTPVQSTSHLQRAKGRA